MNRFWVSPMKYRKNSAGFTLVELMMALAVAAIVLTQAVPSFSRMIKNNRMTTQVNQFVVALNLARSEAVKRGVNIDVIATNATSGNEWGAGWRVEVSGGDTLRTFPALHESNTFDSVNDLLTIQYQPSGRANAIDTIRLCDDRSGETGREVSISTTGRVSTTNYKCS